MQLGSPTHTLSEINARFSDKPDPVAVGHFVDCSQFEEIFSLEKLPLNNRSRCECFFNLFYSLGELTSPRID